MTGVIVSTGRASVVSGGPPVHGSYWPSAHVASHDLRSLGPSARTDPPYARLAPLWRRCGDATASPGEFSVVEILPASAVAPGSRLPHYLEHVPAGSLSPVDD